MKTLGWTKQYPCGCSTTWTPKKMMQEICGEHARELGKCVSGATTVIDREIASRLLARDHDEA